MSKRLTIIPQILHDELQLAAITGVNIPLTGDDVKRVFRLVSAVTLYAAQKGLPDDLFALIERDLP